MAQITEEISLDFNDFLPAIRFENTTLSEEYRSGDPYQLFKFRGTSKAVITFALPTQFRHPTDTLTLSLNHCCTTSHGIIDIIVNGAMFQQNYTKAPVFQFDTQDFSIPFSMLRAEGKNEIVIRLSDTSPGVYWLSDISFEINTTAGGQYGCSHHLNRPVSGAYFDKVAITDAYRRGDPYLLFNERSSECVIEFFIPEEFKQIQSGTCILSLTHCRTSGNGIIDMALNGEVFRSQYSQAPYWNFATEDFPIPFSSLKPAGQLNTFRIQLHAPSDPFGYYWLSDARLTFSSDLPAVTHDNYDRYVKDWILQHRSNIAELSQIPRDDLSAWQFIQNAPSWFYLPFLPASPTEISVLIRNFPTSFFEVGRGMGTINAQAREFHKELITTDLARKNALRHALWMALTTRTYGAKFADELGNAHEYAHVDLTIEGPFDHVTDKINNAVGIELAKSNPRDDCKALVDAAWERNELAWARNFRVEGGRQTADVYWQKPLEKLASTYNVIPDFNDTERATLARMNISVPDKTSLHDEL